MKCSHLTKSVARPSEEGGPEATPLSARFSFLIFILYFLGFLDVNAACIDPVSLMSTRPRRVSQGTLSGRFGASSVRQLPHSISTIPRWRYSALRAVDLAILSSELSSFSSRLLLSFSVLMFRVMFLLQASEPAAQPEAFSPAPTGARRSTRSSGPASPPKGSLNEEVATSSIFCTQRAA